MFGVEVAEICALIWGSCAAFVAYVHNRDDGRLGDDRADYVVSVASVALIRHVSSAHDEAELAALE